jgi:RNA-directed DNA polymerase
MTTRCARFTQKARAEPRRQFNSLRGLLFDPAGLHESFERQEGKKAPGVDGITYPTPLYRAQTGSRMV